MIRLADVIEDRDALIAACKKLQEYAKAYSWTNEVSFDKGVSALQANILMGKGYLIDGYLVMLDIIQPWYSNDKVLQEWLVLKLYPGGTVNSIPPALLSIAQTLGCKSVISADSSPISIVENAYLVDGWRPLTRSFTMKVPDGSFEKLGG